MITDNDWDLLGSLGLGISALVALGLALGLKLKPEILPLFNLG